MLYNTHKDIYSAAKHYLSEGHPIVLQEIDYTGGKKKIISGTRWKGDSCISTITELNSQWQDKYNCIGIRCDNLLVVDFDMSMIETNTLLEKERLFTDEVCSTLWEYTWKNRPHIYFNPSDRIESGGALNNYAIDIQTGPGKVIFCAPSAGGGYRFDCEDPVLDIPTDFEDWIVNNLPKKAVKTSKFSHKETIDPMHSEAYIDAILGKKEVIYEGDGRDNDIMAMAGFLLRKMRSLEHAKDAIHIINEEKYIPPFSSEEVDAKINYILENYIE